MRLVSLLSDSGIRSITVVRGFRKEAIALNGVATVDNDRYANTGEVYSLACARHRLDGETIVVYGDVLFRRYILDGLLAADGDIIVAVDALGAMAGARATPRDLVTAERRFSGNYLDDAPVRLCAISPELSMAQSSGEWIGLARFTGQGAVWLRQELDLIEAEGKLSGMDMPMLITRLAAKHPVFVHYITGHWLDVDTLDDLANARNFT
jgi:phosphoenolpyruvate phosphomutase